MQSRREPIDALPDNVGAETLLRSGADLISDNSGEALGNDRKALEAGIARVERALALGGIDRRKAYTLLAQAYNALHSRTDASREEALAFLRDEGKAYRELAKLDPKDPQWVMNYVDTLTDSAKKVEELRRIVREFENYMPARQRLASRLCELGRIDEGMREAVHIAETLSADEIDVSGGEIIGIGFGCMKHAGAERIRTILERRRMDRR